MEHFTTTHSERQMRATSHPQDFTTNISTKGESWASAATSGQFWAFDGGKAQAQGENQGESDQDSLGLTRKEEDA